MDKLYSIARPALLVIGTNLLFGSVISNTIAKYDKSVRPLCEQVMSMYDANKDGTISYDEGVRLAKAIDGTIKIPTGSKAFELMPGLAGDFSYNIPKGSVYLKIDNHSWVIPALRLEELANDPMLKVEKVWL